MILRNTKRATPPAEPDREKSPLMQWFSSCAAELRAARPALPALRIPPRQKLRPSRPGGVSAWWAARLAVRAGIPIQDFLQHRLARRLAGLSVPASRLPAALSIEAGRVVARPTAPASARRAPRLESFLRAEGPAALAAEIQLTQADAARLAARIEAQRQRVDATRHEVEDSDRGAIADPADEAQAIQMGRPAVPPALGLGLHVFALALLLAETWQIAIPCLGAAGIATGDLLAEAQRNPVSLALGSVFALGAAASLVLCADLGLRRAREIFDASRTRRAGTALAALAAAALGLGLAGSVAAMRPGLRDPVDLRWARSALFLALLAIPFTTAWLLRLARALDAARAQALTAARAWDSLHYRALADLARRSAALSEEEHSCARLEAERAASIRRLRAFQRRGAMAERLAADAADEEESDLSRIAQAITAALEIDRYEYVRQAATRGLAVEHGREPRPASAPGPVRPARPEVGESLGLAG